MIFEKLKLCFVGVPKNGSESIYQILMEAEGCERVHDHLPMRYIFAEQGSCKLVHYIKFGVVRHPYDRFASAYRYLKSHNEWQLDVDETLDFVEMMLSADLLSIMDDLDPVLQPQTLYLCDERGTVIVDDVLRFNQLDKDWEAFVNRPGLRHLLPKTLPKLNSRSDGKSWVELLTTKQLLRISKLYDSDFTRFGFYKSFMQELRDHRLKKQS